MIVPNVVVIFSEGTHASQEVGPFRWVTVMDDMIRDHDGNLIAVYHYRTRTWRVSKTARVYTRMVITCR